MRRCATKNLDKEKPRRREPAGFFNFAGLSDRHEGEVAAVERTGRHPNEGREGRDVGSGAEERVLAVVDREERQIAVGTIGPKNRKVGLPPEKWSSLMYGL